MSERLLLHVCCGPCSIEPVEDLGKDYELGTYYYNPNIHPQDEYARRLATAKGYLQSLGLRFVSAPYVPLQYSNALGTLEKKPERCLRCYSLRLTATAAVAAELDFPNFTTTLFVSPYQDREAILRAGHEAAELAGVRFIEKDWRDRFRHGQQRARELGMYRQKYCGCSYSLAEAEEESKARKAAKAAAGSGR